MPYIAPLASLPAMTSAASIPLAGLGISFMAYASQLPSMLFASSKLPLSIISSISSLSPITPIIMAYSAFAEPVFSCGALL